MTKPRLAAYIFARSSGLAPSAATFGDERLPPAISNPARCERPRPGTMLPQPAPPPPHPAPASPPPGPARFICIECSFPVSSLYTAYSSADDHSLERGVRLTQCPRCKRFADKYVEHDKVVLFIDMVLIKPQVSSDPRLLPGQDGARPANRGRSTATCSSTTSAAPMTSLTARSSAWACCCCCSTSI